MARTVRTTPIPPDLLVWERVDNWRDKVANALTPRLRQELPTLLRNKPPEAPYSDSLLLGPSLHSQRRIADWLATMRCEAYHACRPTDPSSYLRQGILPLDPTVHREALWHLITTDDRFAVR